MNTPMTEDFMGNKVPLEFDYFQAQEYADKRGKNTRFYRNVMNWRLYYTLVPTPATPSGKHRDFPRTITITATLPA